MNTKDNTNNIHDFFIEINPDSDQADTISAINKLLNKNGVEVQIEEKEGKSLLRLSVYRDKLSRNAGRKEDPARKNRLLRYCELMKEGRSQQQIMDELDISQATFFRYKRTMKDQ